MLNPNGGRPMIRKSSITAGAIPLAFVASILALAVEPAGYAAIAGHYESIRQALLSDSTEGVAPHAASIGQAATALIQDFDAASALVPAERSGECLDLLPAIEKAAASLASSKTLGGARDAFGELSKFMVRYRKMLAKPETVVVYCSMAEKVWLQPDGEIGNPYYGQSMARCGEIVSK
jgi:hypothetical protein